MARKGKLVIATLEQVEVQSHHHHHHPHTTDRKRSIFTTPSWILRLEFVLSILNQCLIGFITIYISWMSLRLRATEIPYHALFCTIGFVCLISWGLMAHYRGNIWTQLFYRTEKTRIHWVLQLFGSVIGIAGIAIKIYLEETHFDTLHGRLGLSACILCIFSVSSGLSTLFANELRHHLQPLINKSLHNLLGLATYVLAMLSMFYALETDIFMEYSLDAASFVDFRLMLQIIIILILILSSYGAFWCFIYSKLWKCC